MNRWNEIRTAFEVARLGTVTAAAASLGIHRATVNRHIDALEEDFGTKLFQRHGRGYVLTEAGEAFLSVAQRASDLLSDFIGRTKASEFEVSGDIVVATPPPLASLLMRPIIKFREKHPDIFIRVMTPEELVKLEYGHAHIALHFGERPEQGDYVVQPLRGLQFGLYADQKYVDRKGLPNGSADFADHDFVANPEYADRIAFEAWLSDRITEDQLSLDSAHPKISIEAVLGGVAIGFLPEPYARDRMELHEVVAPREEWTIPVWLVTHVDMHRTEKVQTMLSCIKDATVPPIPDR